MEQEIFKIRPSMKPIAAAYILDLVIIIFIYMASTISPVLAAFVGLLALIILIETLVTHVDRFFTIYTLTSENVKRRIGIIGKSETIVPLIKIQNVNFNYSILQRIFGIGNLIIESAGGHVGGIGLKNINKPEEYSKQILEAAKNFQRSDGQL